jgi:hypothetical protein
MRRLIVVVLVGACASAPLTPVVLPPALDVDAIIGKPVDNAVLIPADLPRFDPVPVPTGAPCGAGAGPGILVDQATAAKCRLDAAAATRWRAEAGAYRALRNQERAACQAADVAYQRQAQRLQVDADRARWAGPLGLTAGLVLGFLAATYAAR